MSLYEALRSAHYVRHNPQHHMATSGNKKVANGLVSLSSAAILVVYAAGFVRTKAAAEKMEEASNSRRRPAPAPPTAGEQHAAAPIEPPAGYAPAPTDLRSPAVAAPEKTTAAAAPADAKSVTKTDAKSDAKPVESAKPATATSATNAAAPTTSSEPAAAPAAAPAAEEKKAEEKPAAPSNLLMPKEKYKDGTYLGWGHCRHGDIQVQVIVEAGRFTSASIAQCWTRYSCSWVSHLPGQVLARQSPDVDYVTGATESANAYYWAVIDALSHAKAPVETPAPEQAAHSAVPHAASTK